MSWTFLALQNELLTQPGARFKPTQRDSVKAWLNARCSSLWGSEDWTFRKVSENLTVAAGDESPTPPSGFGQALGLWTNLGEPVSYVTPKDYLDAHVGQTDTGTPATYTVVDGQILLDPTPSASATYMVFHERLYGHFNAGGAYVAGDMTLDTDVPAIPAEHHYMLVYGALSQGSVLMQDFTYQFAEQEWQNQVAAMKRNYLASTRGESVQWGRG